MNEEHVIISYRGKFYYIPTDKEEEWYYLSTKECLEFKIPDWVIPLYYL